MKLALRVLCSLVIFCFTSALAGGPDVPPPPTYYDGFYVGLGGSYNFTSVDNQDVLRDSFQVQDFANNVNKLAPIFQMGYWGMLGDSAMFGVKAFFKYLNARPHLVYDNALDIFTQDDQVDYEVSLLLLLGYQVHDFLLYIGAGVVVFPSVKSRIDITGDISNICRTLWGGIAQIGFNYYFNPWWFLDASFTYAQTANYLFENPVFGDRATVHIVNKEFIFTINRRF